MFAHALSLVLFGLLPLLFLAWVWTVTRTERHSIDSRIELGLRLLVLLLVALAVVEMPLPGDTEEAVVFLLDRSESIPTESQATTLQDIQSLWPSASEAALVVFAGESAIEQGLSLHALPDRIESQLDTKSTNIAQAIGLSSQLLSRHGTGSGRIVLATDGHQTAGDAEAATLMAAAQGFRLDVLPLPKSADTYTQPLISALRAPSQVRLRERFTLRIFARGAPGSDFSIRLRRNGEVIADTGLRLNESGSSLLTLSDEVLYRGFYHYTASVQVGGASSAVGDEVGAILYASGPSRVLYVSGAGRTDALSSLLTRSGFEVVLISPAAFPKDFRDLGQFEVVVLQDVPVPALPEGATQLIYDYVTEFGGGLVMTGAGESFAPGGYLGTPVETTLPVELKLPASENTPSLALVLLFDKSGSMAGKESGRKKIDLAAQAAAVAVGLLSPRDWVGLIAFDRQAEELLNLTQNVDSSQVKTLLSAIQAAGATSIYPAVQLAESWLLKTEAARRQILLLSDGRTTGRSPVELAPSLKEHTVVTSVVGTGTDADQDMLRTLATATGGRYYSAETVAELAEILVRETIISSGRWLLEETLTPKAGEIHPVLMGVAPAELASLQGYVAAIPRPTASHILVGENQVPVLSVTHAGLGRTAVLLTDLLSTWGEGLMCSPAFPRLWTQLLRWTAGGATNDSLFPRFVREGEDGRLIVDAQSARGYRLNGFEGDALVRGPDGKIQTVEMIQVAPGRYEGHFEGLQRGAYRTHLILTGPDERELACTFGSYFGHLAEQHAVGNNLAFLRRLAAAGGGKLLEPGEPLPASKPSSEVGSRPWVFLLPALVFLLIELAIRQVGVVGLLGFARLS